MARRVTTPPGGGATTRRAGRLWLVGAGPGDPDLLTVAARRLLDEADIVVHDRLVGEAILATIPVGTPRINVGKTGYAGGADQREINRRLVELVRAGHEVVRLKGGDPFVFGRGAEELLALAAEGVDVRIVPGITAGIAAPAAFGIPVTHRGVAASVAFVTGHREAGDAAPPDWDALARIDTVVVYMGGRTASTVARCLLDAGRGASTPVAVIAAATTDQARIRVTDLAGLAADPPRELRPELRPDPDPVLLVIGDVVRLHDAVASPAMMAG